MGNPLVKNLVLPINEHITYTVDFGGNVYSHKPSGIKLLSKYKHKARGDKLYEGVRAGSKTYLVHRLMIAAKLGRMLKPSEQVNHINGNTQDNRMCNLELVTHAQNVQHAVANNLYCSGEAWHKARSKN
ncbi:HNH endonuclease [Vibrio phage JSF3]|uniref:Putative HNH homing endonuclease n=2 Tax=Pacinivirus VCO139 TaxID=2846607 RepID=R9R4G6_9CAUD|nr:HNH endonuclease [Vibrio phage JA-1]YP_009874336.1 HNH endonuclease [Vibrio phage VCO139]YP_009876286.1 HNH endonuclease [Vibrio phage JSF3]AGI61787.1 putative HNH homing endonuclease [Vibrio phage JA-1]AGI61864.1 putative HNH homing endonuclease [Vibrio phage VCO139]APD18073.1 hypothetical protein [Vibrio phage JSF3]